MTSGFDDYVEIFKGGTQTDSSGMEVNGSELIDKALALFNPEHHEPPVCLGHPKDNSPAYGWISGLKRKVHDGEDLLLAKYKDVDPDFISMVKSGKYKKRSASFYPDGSLRHVGYLGAMPPAVKGLKNMKFDESKTYIMFYDTEEPQVPKCQLVPKSLQDFGTSQQEEKSMANEKEFKEKEAQFIVEKEKFAAENEALKKTIAEMKFAERRTNIKHYIDSAVASGKITPAQQNAGLQECLEFLEGLESSTLTFAEGATKPLVEVFKEIIECKVGPTFGEVDSVSNQTNKPVSGKVDIRGKIREFQEKHKVDYATASLEISKQFPKYFELNTSISTFEEKDGDD